MQHRLRESDENTQQDHGFGGLSRFIAGKWKQLDENERRPFEEASLMEKRRFEEAMAKLKNNPESLKEDSTTQALVGRERDERDSSGEQSKRDAQEICDSPKLRVSWSSTSLFQIMRSSLTPSPTPSDDEELCDGILLPDDGDGDGDDDEDVFDTIFSSEDEDMLDAIFASEDEDIDEEPPHGPATSGNNQELLDVAATSGDDEEVLGDCFAPNVDEEPARCTR
jgi:hypothetical protein